MDNARSSQASSTNNRMSLERKSGRELVVTRTIDAPPRIVFEAWTQAELFRRWWVPKSLGLTLLSCELDVRVGGGYRLVFSHPAAPGAHGVPRQVPGSDTALASRLDPMTKRVATGRSPRSPSRKEPGRRCSSCTTSILRRRRSTKTSAPAARAGTTRRSTNSKSFSAHRPAWGSSRPIGPVNHPEATLRGRPGRAVKVCGHARRPGAVRPDGSLRAQGRHAHRRPGLCRMLPPRARTCMSTATSVAAVTSKLMQTPGQRVANLGCSREVGGSRPSRDACHFEVT